MEIKSLKTLLLAFLSPVALSAGDIVSVAEFDFNDGFQGWTPQTGTRLEWVVEQIAPEGHANSFSAIDPEDVSSLFMIPPQSMAHRTKSHVTSPSVSVPDEAELSFYVGYAGIFSSSCSMQLQISADNFISYDVLWTSKGISAPPSWTWHLVATPLNEYAGKNVKFRFFYTTGTYQSFQDYGGYMGDFAIDNFLVTAPAPPDDAVETIMEDTDANITIFSISGLLLYKGPLNKLPSLPQGIKIVRDNKSLTKIIR